MAALPGQEDDDAAKAKPSRLAFGYSVSLLDQSDPFFAKTPEGLPAWTTCTAQVSREANAADDLQAYIASSRTPGRYVAGLADALADNFGQAGSPEQIRKILADPEARKDIDRVLAEFGKPPADKLFDKQIVDFVQEAALAWQATEDAEVTEANTRLRALPSATVLAEGNKECAKQAAAAARGAQDLDLGFGAVWSGAPGKLDELADPGGAVWLAYKRPLVTPASKDALTLSIGGSARYAWRESVATGDATTPTFLANTTDAWVGLEAASNRYRFTAQYGWFDADARERVAEAFSQSGGRYLVGASLALLGEENGVWANLSYGSAAGTTDARDETLLVTLTFAPPKDGNIFGLR